MPNNSQDPEPLSEIAEHHRLAATHFSLAAQHHHAAAEADHEMDLVTAAFHSYSAHAQQLRAIQHAETAAELGIIEEMESHSEDCDCE
ncbi:MAG: hypothetical protein WCO60_17860 [Verrucomicrobiota bacterium]